MSAVTVLSVWNIQLQLSGEHMGNISVWSLHIENWNYLAVVRQRFLVSILSYCGWEQKSYLPVMSFQWHTRVFPFLFWCRCPSNPNPFCSPKIGKFLFHFTPSGSSLGGARMRTNIRGSRALRILQGHKARPRRKSWGLSLICGLMR